MPIREYQACDPKLGCPQCCTPFERLETHDTPKLDKCPSCGQPLQRLLSSLRVGVSQTSFDQRAKNAGFKKLKKLSRGEYEVKY